jgi:hypothetical protein
LKHCLVGNAGAKAGNNARVDLQLFVDKAARFNKLTIE